MRIVVLDGHTLNPGDLSWEPLKTLGPCDVHERTASTELISRALDAGILLTNKVEIGAATIANLPNLKFIGVTATGTNIVDLEAARKRDIPVTNVPSYGTASVAQATIALLLELTHGVGHHAQTVRVGRWSASRDFCYWDQPLIELFGLTMGIIGLGSIGLAVAKLSVAFGMTVLATPSTRNPAVPWVKYVGLEELLRQSDVVSLHCPLTAETRGLINARTLGWIKPSAFLINSSRGQLIDEAALAEALNVGRIAGAGLDVLSLEPPPPANPLLQARNCIITPHFAWATRAARQRLMDATVNNVRAFLQGRPVNVVN
ncbi:MAG TPA: D-2-hydroxyacid dehydrogenase [Verrucomicrobiae bacterium]|nr:D-2-hydroxyacid dehydrogenase [Verrucomicrobiae bacterium]